MYNTDYSSIYYILERLEKRAMSLNEEISEFDYDVYKFNAYRNRKTKEVEDSVKKLNKDIKNLQKKIKNNS